jgi:chemotaxis protein CheD
MTIELPTEVLTLFQSETREAFYDIWHAAREPGKPFPGALAREMLYLIRGNAQALSLGHLAEMIVAAQRKIAKVEDGAAIAAILSNLEHALVDEFKQQGWDARRDPADRADGNSTLHVFLYPGHIYASPTPGIVTTLLGSCVSVCLWDERKRQGGLNHFMLPTRTRSEENAARFGNSATAGLLEQMHKMGSRNSDLKAKVFGGSRLIAGESPNKLGDNNVASALAMLTAAGVNVVERETGGHAGRKVVFDLVQGSTRVTRI